MSPPMAAPGDDAEERRRILRLILVLGIAVFAGALTTRATDPLVAEIGAEFLAPPERTALLSTAFALPFALIQPVLGPVADAVGKWRVIGVSLALLTVLLLASAFAPDLGSLLALRALSGAAAGGVMPVTLAMMGDAVPLRERQVAISRLLVFGISGQIAGGAAAGGLAVLVGWRGVLAICALPALVAAVVVLVARRRRPPEPLSRFDPVLALRRYRAILTNPAALLLYAAVAIEGALVFGVFPYIAPLLIARGLGATAEAGLAVGAFGLGGFAYAAVARALLARMGQGRMVVLGGVLAGGALAGLALAPLFGAVAGAMLLLGTGFYMMHNSIQVRVTEVAPQARASAVSLHAFSFFVGQSLGPVLYGIGFGAAGSGVVLGLGCAALVLLGLVLGRRPR